MSNKITQTAQAVLEKRYFINGESTWEHLVNRVSNHFGSTQEEKASFRNTMLSLDFLPNSPALMNAGTSIKAYSACYVLPVEDSIESIFKYYSDAGLISKSGGGVGANFNNIRSSGSVVNSTDGVASGPISFIEGQNALTEVIKQGGRRRGANMGILMCDHPDIWNFVGAKDTEGALENFNLSVGITDEFMEIVTDKDNVHWMAVADDEYPKERVLWDELIQRAWSSAEPGVLFIDEIQRGNTTPHLGDITAVNPCGEQPLLPYESCTLGSINLSNHVIMHEPYTSDDTRGYEVDYFKLKDTVHTGVLFLNRILDKSEMPIPECQEAMELTRKIGLGIMGLHDMLIQLGFPYDSEEGRKIAGEVMEFIAEEADKVSRELGQTEGYYTAATLTNMETHSRVEAPLRRNANLTTIAPTGTLSLLCDCSSGCEPYYAPVTYKTVLDGTEFEMPNKWVAKRIEEEQSLSLGNVECYDDLTLQAKALFKGAEDVHWSDHIKMQAVLQRSVDSSISKTINMPENATVADVKEAYEMAWKMSLKGVTIYRDNSRSEQVLSTDRKDKTTNDTQEPTRSKANLGDTLAATRYRVKVKDQKVYILVCEDDNGVPMEIFAKFPFEGGGSWNTLCRMISLSLRYGVPLDEVIKQLEKSVIVLNDLPSHLSRILKMYQQSKGVYISNPCPDCSNQLTFEEGCEHCGNCGYSKCG